MKFHRIIFPFGIVFVFILLLFATILPLLFIAFISSFIGSNGLESGLSGDSLLTQYYLFSSISWFIGAVYFGYNYSISYLIVVKSVMFFRWFMMGVFGFSIVFVISVVDHFHVFNDFSNFVSSYSYFIVATIFVFSYFIFRNRYHVIDEDVYNSMLILQKNFVYHIDKDYKSLVESVSEPLGFISDNIVIINRKIESINNNLPCVESYFDQHEVGCVSHIAYETNLSDIVIGDCLQYLDVRKTVYHVKCLESDCECYVWNVYRDFSDIYVDKVVSYFLVRQMGDYSDVLSFSDINKDLAKCILSYLVKRKDLELVVKSPTVYKWTHDIDFSEGIETVELEL